MHFLLENLFSNIEFITIFIVFDYIKKLFWQTKQRNENKCELHHKRLILIDLSNNLSYNRRYINWVEDKKNETKLLKDEKSEISKIENVIMIATRAFKLLIWFCIFWKTYKAFSKSLTTNWTKTKTKTKFWTTNTFSNIEFIWFR